MIDLAKAAAGLLDAPQSARSNQTTTPRSAGSAALTRHPPLLGTGSSQVVAVPDRSVAPLNTVDRHPHYLPRLVILDPCLLRSCPPATRAAAGLDAFVQAFESFTSRHATPFTRALSELAVTRLARALLPF